MRKDIKINVDTQTDGISLSSRRLGISSENLQGKIIFTPKPFIDGICRMYIEGHGSIVMDKQEDCYTLDIKSSLLITPSIDVCFKITEPEQNNGVPIYATKIMHFEVLDTIESNEPIPEQYPQWTEKIDKYVETKETELDTYTTDKKTELDTYKTDLEKEMSTTKDNLVNDFNGNAETKTTDFNNNAVAKTEEYNTNATNKVNEFNNNVDSLENELTELANQMPWNTTEIQDSIHVEDSAKYSRNKLGLFGDLVQEKRSGKSLIDFSNYVGKASTVEYSFTDDVIIVTQKGAQSYAGVSFNILDIIKNNPSKELKFIYETLDVSSFSSDNKRIIQIEMETTETKIYYGMLDKDNTSTVYTIPADTSNITKAELKILTNNSTGTIETSTVKITKPMLLFTDTTDETYEKYGAMPSIEYPSMPVVTTGVQKIRKIGKNIFNNDYWEQGMIKDADGTILSNNSYIRTKLIPIKPNEDYVLNMYTERLYEYDINGNWIKTTQFGNPSTFAKKNLKIKTNVDTCYVRFRYHIGHTDSIITTLADMKKQENLLAIGTDVNIPYEPYTEETFELDLGTTELCKIVDENNNVVAQDRAVYKDGKWQFEKNTYRRTLNENDNWQVSGNKYTTFYVSSSGYPTPYNTGGNCNYFKWYKSIWQLDEVGYDMDSTNIRFNLSSKAKMTTIDEWKNWLKEHNLEIYYPRRTTIYENCTPAQSQVLDKLHKLTLQQGTNNIFVESENGVTTELQLTYMQDLMSQINELKQAMLNIGGN